ncbi:hypothetical protein [Dyella sp. 20L07]|uniref:hypothetical protein n=1 Tax=Dyella sp. 20L07 TaxID=3384240 RepID=UPI003D293437
MVIYGFYQEFRKMRVPLYALLLSLLSVSPAWASTVSSDRDLATDAGLLAFVQQSDTVMSRVLDVCSDVSIARSKEKGLKVFRLKAMCTVKANPEENLDCPAYRVDASGTIDNAIQATVRRLTMSLVCSA